MQLGLGDGLGGRVGEGESDADGDVGRLLGDAERVGVFEADGVADGEPDGVPEVLAEADGRAGRALCLGVGLDAPACGVESPIGACDGPVSASGPLAKVPDDSAAAVHTTRTRPTPAPVSSRVLPRRRARRGGGRRRAARPPVKSGSGGAAGVPATGAGSTGTVASCSTGVPQPGHDRAPLRCRRHE